MKTPIRKCRFCGKKGKWKTYVIWDKDNPNVGTGKNKWWECDFCDTERTEDKERVLQQVV